MPICALTEREIRPGSREVTVAGELDLAAADRLADVLDRALVRREEISIDLLGCEFIDSRGVEVLLGAQHRIAEQGNRLLLHGVAGQVRRILSLTGASEHGLLISEARRSLAGAPAVSPGSDRREEGGFRSAAQTALRFVDAVRAAPLEPRRPGLAVPATRRDS